MITETLKIICLNFFSLILHKYKFYFSILKGTRMKPPANDVVYILLLVGAPATPKPFVPIPHTNHLLPDLIHLRPPPPNKNGIQYERQLRRLQRHHLLSHRHIPPISSRCSSLFETHPTDGVLKTRTSVLESPIRTLQEDDPRQPQGCRERGLCRHVHSLRFRWSLPRRCR